MSELNPGLWGAVHEHYDNPNDHFLNTEMYLKFFTSVYGEHVEEMWGLE